MLREICRICVLGVCGFSSVEGTLQHRWSFDEPAGDAPSGTVLIDSVSGVPATVWGQFQQVSTLSGSALRFYGTGDGNHSLRFLSGYLDLPNGIISSKTNLTVEVWATPFSVTSYDRVFDFGRCRTSDTHGPNAADGEIIDINQQGAIPGQTQAVDNLYFSFAVGNNANAQRLSAAVDGVFTDFDSSVATTFGTAYHYVMTFEDGVGSFGASGGRVSWYRDGVLIHAADVNFRLQDLEDVNNWLGRSQWANDWNADAAYDELRIWDHALTPSEIAGNFANGPDSLVDNDTDDDGLLDSFEDQYFGNNDGTATPAELALQSGGDNPDNDALTNLEEQQLGTNPTDDQSPPPPPSAAHLWTFTTQADSTAESGLTFVDEVGGSWEVVLQGNGGALDGQQVILPGNTNGNQTATSISAYLDLSNGIISDSPNLTIEAWATPLSSRNWQRLFDFGRTVQTSGPGAITGEVVDGPAAPGFTGAWDNLSLTLNNGGDFNTHQLEGEFDDNGPVFTTSSIATVPGVEYHYALVIEDGVGEFGATGCRVTWYRDGVFQNSDDFNFRLVDMEDVNNWIGRSMYTGDSNSHLALNELRIYRQALTVGQIQTSLAAGPDPSSGPPEPPAPAPIPVRLWDFNVAAGSIVSDTDFLDAAFGEVLTTRGNGATADGNRVILPGGSNGGADAASISAYLELPNGFISSFSDLTVEGWITPLSNRNWQRAWDFGNCTVTHGPGAAPGEIVDDVTAPPGHQANDNLFLSLNVGGDLGAHRLGGKLNAGGETGVNTDLTGATAEGTEYHFVMTVEEGAGSAGATGCLVRWYRDAVLFGSIDLNFRLSDMEDVNNWIGRSNWGDDQNSHMAINELRIYDRALTSQEVSTSFGNGADATFAPPVANADAATLHTGQKVLLDVLANDANGPDASTVLVTSHPSNGTVDVKPDGKILYTHGHLGNSPDSFTYSVSNFSGTSNPATVEITVTADLRIANSEWAMPAELPPTTWVLEDALPGLSFVEPIALSSIPGDADQLYVSERMAKIQRVDDVASGTPAKNLFLDLQAVVASFPDGTASETIEGGGNQENGLLGLAFHPDYASNGYFYVAYTVRKNGGSYYQRISRFSRDATDPTQADPSSQLVLLEQLDEGANHNGGDLHFGPDGYLYYAAGDEENSGRGQQNSQLINVDFFGGVFRLDVDKKLGNLEPHPHPAIPTDEAGNAYFSVPADNPFVHNSLGGAWDGTYNGSAVTPLTSVRTEFWATGLRHVWRMSFDSLTGDLWGGDVGQVTYEEVVRIEKGLNYGWAYREGAHDFNTVIGDPPAGWSSVDPVYEYLHNGVAGGDASFKGNSVVGGYVYRGVRYPSLYGRYVFCDSVSGHVWEMDPASGVVTRITGLPGNYGVFSSMGVDPSNQDILFCAYNEGKIRRLAVGGESEGGFPKTLSETGLFADLTDLSPAPGLLPYDLNLRFWSDHADKRRWFGIPDATSKMTWQAEGPWSYPTGMVWVKHFDLSLTRGNPATHKRIETRVIVKQDNGVYGVTYRWNEEGTEAFLVGDAGDQFDLAIDDGGSPHTQTWELPSRTSCLTCHGDQPLSFNTRQLNLAQAVHGFSGNLLDLLSSGGYFHNMPAAVETLPFHVRPDEIQYPLEQRARSYLEVNCAYCHQDGGSVAQFWDGRGALTLEQTGLINVDPVVNGGDPNNKYVVPLSPSHSVLLHRIAATPPFTRMPPVATSELDVEAIQLITDWINATPTNRLYDDWAGPNGYNLTGSRRDDDDNDGRSNYDEFLLGSNPLSANDFAAIELDPAGTLNFTRKAFRNYDVETSTDLQQWESWSNVGNVWGFGEEDAAESLSIDTLVDDWRFFRLRVSEP